MAALVVLVAAVLSNVAGFAFSALAGALIFHIAQAGVEAIQIILLRQSNPSPPAR